MLSRARLSPDGLRTAVAGQPRVRFATLPTPIHRLQRLGDVLDGPELWIKRDDMTGFAGGGNKTRKLEFLVADAKAQGAKTLVTVGALQSNHTRQTAAAAARTGMRCVLLHNAWAPDARPAFRTSGNLLFSGLFGATLYYDSQPRHIDDQGRLAELVRHLAEQGAAPYLIPGGGSEHRLGGLGYVNCAAEIIEQSTALALDFDVIVHCTGSSSTQAGLLAGLAALGSSTRVIGVADDDETDAKRARILTIANLTLGLLGLSARVTPEEVEVVAATDQPYGHPTEPIFESLRLLASHEGIVADPVYEGRALCGLIELIRSGRLRRGHRVLLMHLGGSPALHAWGESLNAINLSEVPL